MWVLNVVCHVEGGTEAEKIGCLGIYRVSQEECARLRESVPYVKVYRYNPKHLYPKLNGYGDNGQRKVGGSLRFQILQPVQLIRHVTMRTSLTVECSVHCACVTHCAVSHVTSPLGFLMYSACNPRKSVAQVRVFL